MSQNPKKPSKSPKPLTAFSTAVKHLLKLLASGDVAGPPNIDFANNRKSMHDLIANVLVQCIDEQGIIRNRGRSMRITTYEAGALITLLLEDVQRAQAGASNTTQGGVTANG